MKFVKQRDDEQLSEQKYHCTHLQTQEREEESAKDDLGQLRNR